jgi:hypothetical protein
MTQRLKSGIEKPKRWFRAWRRFSTAKPHTFKLFLPLFTTQLARWVWRMKSATTIV